MPKILDKKKVVIIDDDFRNLFPLFKAIDRENYNATYILGNDINISTMDNIGLIILDARATKTGAVGFFWTLRQKLRGVSLLIASPSCTFLYKDGVFYQYIGGNLINNINDVLEVLLHNNYPSACDKRFGLLVGNSSSMKEVYARVEKIAKTNVTVLIQGETGTGKELVARTIHLLSHRSEGPFVAINCGAIPQGLVESELFGHERGAFTSAFQPKKGSFEVASGGTIFLDEIADIDKVSQVKILRVLQEKCAQRVGCPYTYNTDVRVIAATSKDLEEEITKGTFREDLYFRINVFPIKVPPLRDRKEDIPLLVNHFLIKYAKELSLDIPSISEEAMQALTNYSYPGNVRELENIIIRILVLSRNNIISAGDVQEQFNFNRQGLSNGKYAMKQQIQGKLEEIEQNAIIDALSKANGNRRLAAEMLGITRRLLYLRLKKYGLNKKASNSL